MKVTFLGAAGAVTGSKYLLELGGRRVLIDCGLFQGIKRLRERNWQPLPFDPRSLDAVLLTHAHIDHSGYLPVLVREGYAGPIYCMMRPEGCWHAWRCPDRWRGKREMSRRVGARARRAFVTHGEPAAADALRQHLRRALPLEVTVPEQGESYSSK